jgi:hypothetical protein
MLSRSVEVVFLLLLSSVLYAGDPVFSRFGAGEAAMAYSCVALKDQWSVFHNQASMAFCNSFTAGFSVESRFMMTDMSTRALGVIIPGKHAPLGVITTWYGNSQYSVITGGLGSAVMLTERLSMGVQADIITERCAGRYRDLTHVTFETGLLAQLSPQVMFGVHLFNPLTRFNNLQASMQSGMTWSPDNNLLFAIEAVKSSNEPLSLHTGISWDVSGAVILRAGYSTSPSHFAFGAGFSFNAISVDTGFLINNITGVTPSVSFMWKQGKR